MLQRNYRLLSAYLYYWKMLPGAQRRIGVERYHKKNTFATALLLLLLLLLLCKNKTKLTPPFLSLQKVYLPFTGIFASGATVMLYCTDQEVIGEVGIKRCV